MSPLDNKVFYKLLDKAATENMVKAAYAKLFNMDLDDSDFIDLYTPSVLFEFNFLADIKDDNNIILQDQNKVIFRLDGGKLVEKRILSKKYQEFWQIYDRVQDADTLRGIQTKVDRINDDFKRRMEGEFFTPLSFAQKGLDYLEKTVGKQWWKHGYRLWDMAAGTGNLEYYLPAEAYEHLYLSSLHHEDVDYCKTIFPAATCFQYDYLNDDVALLNTLTDKQNKGKTLSLFAEDKVFAPQYKMPKNLQQDLANPKIKWLILMNPPFATAQVGGAKGDSKKDVSDTKIRTLMHRADLGEVSRELFSQFLFRVKYEFRGKEAHLGLFSKIKYVNSNNDQKFRDDIFQFSFERGFMFSSAHFSGTSKASQFPVGFLIWHLNRLQKIENQKIELDLFDAKQQKTGVKEILVEHRDRFLSTWADRPPAKAIMPPVGSSIKIRYEGKDVRNRVSSNFLASLMSKGNDLQNQNYTALLSMPYVSAGAYSVEPSNFEQSMITHAVRRIPKATWTNDRDQFLQPQETVSAVFTNDCVVWSLFAPSNETVAMRDVKYLDKLYQITNHFFPFLLKDLKKWRIRDTEISMTTSRADDRFVATWLSQHSLSTEAENVLKAGKDVYQYYFEHLNDLDLSKYKIATWDAGWWQIRNALGDQNVGEDLLQEVKTAHETLKWQLEPQIYTYGFLSR